MTDYDKLKKCFDEIGIEYEDIVDPYKHERLIRLFSSCLPIEIYSFVFKSNGSFVKID